MSGMITKPPPYDRAPTLSATQTKASRPPVDVAAAAAIGQTCTPMRPPRSTCQNTTSTAPQPSSTRTSHGPNVAAAPPPSAAYTIQRQCASARFQLSGTRPTPARTATAATAAPAPAPTLRTQSGGELRNTTASARIAASPGRMNARPPTTAPIGPATRQAQKIASWVEAGPGSKLIEGKE